MIVPCPQAPVSHEVLSDSVSRLTRHSMKAVVSHAWSQ